MPGILVGTCSWTDPALVRSGWYPPGARDAEGRLRHYAGRFPVVEVDSSFYGLPSGRNARLWAERTPDGFVFDVKAFAPLTGHRVRSAALPADLRGAPVTDEVRAELWRRFAGALDPLRAAGRLGAVLLQLPPWTGPSEQGHRQLARCRALAGDLPLAVEFRHPGWLAPGELPRTLGLLAAYDLSLVAVDTAPGLARSMPPVTAVTRPELAVVRFHGRSPAWGTGTKEESYRHDYTADELAGWAREIRCLSRRAHEVHVLFNNCCGSAAVEAAATMQELLAAGTADGA
ncbi:DUF72 domain-containing protein [Streptomyces orinoci]|uniref:DUF72 domain-containing protein n=1 Tax=Streptomyces orinoci TaxID=67339 RepID=A0ABV3KBB5_STRON|nr:DUF72 domain-containing protein [Streptomyces orinoci]